MSESRPFERSRAQVDARVLRAFESVAIRRALLGPKLSLQSLWDPTARILARTPYPRPTPSLDVHQAIVDGLPGAAMFASAAMAFDSLQEALPFFEISQKTAKEHVDRPLTTHQGEIALRLGRVLTFAAETLGSWDSAKRYLRTPNFALGGAAPRDLLKTADGERIVLSELQAQADGGPV